MQKAKILLIDDEKALLNLLRENLQAEGYEVITASDGEEGLKKAQNEKPDLVICDVIMPKKDGFEVLKVLRQNTKFQVPFIMLTVVNDFEKIKKAYYEEADFYVTKPVKLAKLVKNIQILLNISKNKIT